MRLLDGDGFAGFGFPVIFVVKITIVVIFILISCGYGCCLTSLSSGESGKLGR